MVTQGILFAINTTGGGKAKLAFAAVAAGVFLVGRKLNAARKEAEQFHDTFSRLTQEQRESVRVMERVTAGLVDTKQEMDSVVKLTEAQMKATPELMSAIGRLAADVGQKLGEGPEGITTRVKKLTDAIAKGQSRALKEYGIDLIETEDLIEAQAEAYDKVIARAEGVTIAISNLSEQQFALTNNFETFVGLMVGGTSPIGILANLNDEFSRMNDSMMDANDATADVSFSMEGMVMSTASAVFGVAGMVTGLEFLTAESDRATGALGGLIAAQTRLNKAQSEMKAIKTEEKWIADNPLVVLELLKESGDDAAYFNELVAQAMPIQAANTKRELKLLTQGVEPKDDDGGGGAKKAVAAPALTGSALWQSELDAAERSKQIAFDKHIWLIENNQDYHDEIERQQIEADTKLGEANAVEAEVIEATQEQKWQRQLQAQEQEKLLSIEHHEWLLLNSTEYAGKQAKLDQRAADERVKISRDEQKRKYDTAMYGANLMSGMAKNMSSLMQTENKKQFEIGKKFAYASAVMDTAMGSAAAIAGGIKTFGIPWGLVAGLAAAATVTVAGGVQIATIKKQKFGSSGGGVSAGAVGSGGGGYLGGGGNYAAGGAGAGTTTHNFTFILGEEEFHSAVITANDKASQKGDPAFAQEDAA